MEIQNSERRNSEYAFFESQREHETQRQQLLEANQSKLNERIHLCSRLGMEDHLHQESYARNCQEIAELKRGCYQEEIQKHNEDWKNFQCSMIRNHEQ